MSSYKTLLNELTGLEFRDLVALYLEANSGGYRDLEEVFTVEELQALEELEEKIKAAIE